MSKANYDYLNNAGLTRLVQLINAKFAPLNSPALTGTPTAPTAAAGTDNTQIATTAFVKAAVNNATSGSHTHTGDQVSLTGYEIADNVAVIAATDTVNEAIGKLEKAISEKQDKGSYLTTTGTAADSDKLGGIAASSYALAANIPTVPTNVSSFTNDAGYLTAVAWNDVSSKPSFATVATSGSYNDLDNKPTIPTVPTNVSDFTNDAGYITGVAWGDVTGKPSTFEPATHEHNYAGSSTAGGAATSANKLNTDAGSVTQPVYFNNGVPVAVTHTLGKDVPSDAVFTDTKNTAGSTNSTSKLFLVGATSQAANPQTYSSSKVYETNGALVADSFTGNLTGNVTGNCSGTAGSVAWDNITGKPETFPSETHGHSYAGSSSDGGAATSANKLNTDAGSATQPVYFNSGIPVATTYSLAKSVPSDAVFTDTKVTNTLGTTTKFYVTGTTNAITNTGGQTFDTGVYVSATAGELVATKFTGSLNGNANTASKIYTSEKIGDTNKPVYIAADGTVTPISYAINKDVPSDAVFTDTKDWASITGKPTFATVATSGSYNDLSNKPTIPTITDTYNGTSSNGMSGKAVKSAIDAALVSAYKPSGSIAFASLPTLSASVMGNVYNITDAFTITNNFVEYDSNKTQTFPAGTEVAVINTGTTSSPTYKFSVMSGFIDLSGYQSTSTAVTHTASTAAGSATQPVYVDASGVATACTYTLAKSVPSNAVFTDTNTKVNVTLGTTTKAYLLATSTAPTSTATGVTAIGDTGVYLGTTAGELVASKFTGNLTGNVTGDCSGSAGSVAWDNVTGKPSTFEPSTHEHNYAGSSSAGGAATSANKINTDAGSATQPVYFSNGIPVATTYSLAKSVPSNAVFTDTNNAVTNTLGTTTKFYVTGTTSATTNTGTQYFDTGVYVSTTAGELVATKFTGELNGNAATATKLGTSTVGGTTTPIYLNAGVPTALSYTIAKSVPSDAVFTDTNNAVTNTLGTTTKFYVTGTTSATTNTGGQYFDTGVYVSATAGELVATKFTGELNGNAATATKLGTSTVGGTTTPIYLNAGVPTALSYTIAKSVPSNAVFTDTNNAVTNTLGTTTKFYITGTTSATTNTGGQYFDTGVYVSTTAGELVATKFTGDLTGNVTGNCSGSSGSCTGNAATATTATKLGTSTVGGTTTPIYLNAGTPTALSYTIAKSVPSNAVFTDTLNTAGSTDTSSKIFLVGATSQAANPQTYSDNEIYATDGVLTTKSIQVGGTACTIQYNSTNQCIDFVFAA